MIESLQVSGVNAKLSGDTESYARKKIGGLDRFIPSKNRGAVKVEIKLSESKRKTANDKFTCEVIMHLPHEPIAVTEKAQTALAAIDLAENNLKVQLKKYKEKHGGPQLHRRVASRFKRSLRLR